MQPRTSRDAARRAATRRARPARRAGGAARAARRTSRRAHRADLDLRAEAVGHALAREDPGDDPAAAPGALDPDELRDAHLRRLLRAEHERVPAADEGLVLRARDDHRLSG